MQLGSFYSKVAVITCLIVGITVTVYFIVLDKRIRQNLVIAANNKKIEETLHERNASWRLDPDYLANLNQQYERYRTESLMKLCDVFNRANLQFKPLYDEHNNNISVQEWKESVLVFHYEDLYLQVRDKLARPPYRTYLEPQILKLKQNEMVPRESIYRLVAQIYLVDQIATLAVRHHLRLSDRKMFEEYAKEEKIETRDAQGKPLFSANRPPALITVLPTHAHYLSNQKEHFMDEFPIRIRCRGKLRNLLAFILDLTSNNHFLPLKAFRVRAIGYEQFNNLATVRSPNEDVEADLTICGFLVLKDTEELKRERAKRVRVKRKWKKGA